MPSEVELNNPVAAEWLPAALGVAANQHLDIAKYKKVMHISWSTQGMHARKPNDVKLKLLDDDTVIPGCTS